MPPPAHQMSARGLFLLTDTSPNHNDAHQRITTTTPRCVTNDMCPDVCHPTPNHPRHSTPPTCVINQPHGWPRHPPPRCRPCHPPTPPPASQTQCRRVTTTMADASPTYQHPPTSPLMSPTDASPTQPPTTRIVTHLKTPATSPPARESEGRQGEKMDDGERAGEQIARSCSYSLYIAIIVDLLYILADPYIPANPCKNHG